MPHINYYKRVAIVAALIALPVFSSSAQIGFDILRNSLAIIDTGDGVGSGFIVIIDGVRYLVTNCHVVMDAKRLSIHLIDGQELIPSAIDIADEYDLVRFRLKDDADLQALQLSQSTPTLNQSILVLGNSDGRGVITQLEGKILGLGPGNIEVDAGFVSGNSGSPIISSYGEVLGVATYVTRATPNKNWITQGTRFENTRRFGIRVTNGMKWNRISWRQLVSQTALIDEVNEYSNDLIIILACWRNYQFVDNPRGLFRKYAISLSNQQPSGLQRYINSFIKQYALYIRDGHKYSERSFTMSSRRDALSKEFRALSVVARQQLKKEAWVSSDYANQAKELDELLALLSDETDKVLESSRFWQLNQYSWGGILDKPDIDLILR